jgi:hypothetical protein
MCTLSQSLDLPLKEMSSEIYLCTYTHTHTLGIGSQFLHPPLDSNVSILAQSTASAVLIKASISQYTREGTRKINVDDNNKIREVFFVNFAISSATHAHTSRGSVEG